MSSFKNNFQKAAELVADADALVIAAGVGIAVDFGPPDFRGNTGFWNAYPALAKAQTSFTDVAKALFAGQLCYAQGFSGLQRLKCVPNRIAVLFMRILLRQVVTVDVELSRRWHHSRCFGFPHSFDWV
jgi:hypothetical protein